MSRAKYTIMSQFKELKALRHQLNDAIQTVKSDPDLTEDARSRRIKAAEDKYTAMLREAEKRLHTEFDNLGKELQGEYARKDSIRYGASDYTMRLQATLQVLEAAKCAITPTTFHDYVANYAGDPLATEAINNVIHKYLNPMEAVNYVLPDERKAAADHIATVQKSTFDHIERMGLRSEYPAALLDASTDSFLDYLGKCNENLTSHTASEE